MKKIIFLIFILLLIYSFCYFIFPTEITIIQLEKDKLNIETLLSKQPIVIENKINTKFINNVFKYNIIKKYKNNKLWNRTSFKYTIIYANKNTNIFISNPKELKTKIPNKEDIVIDIKLKKHQSIILPFRWYYSLLNKNDVLIYGIHDYITYIYDFIS